MINGTQFMAALGSEALVRASIAMKQADVVAALTLETLHGTHRAFDEKVWDRNIDIYEYIGVICFIFKS